MHKPCVAVWLLRKGGASHEPCKGCAHLWVSLVLSPADGNHSRADEAGHVVNVAVDHLSVTCSSAATSSHACQHKFDHHRVVCELTLHKHTSFPDCKACVDQRSGEQAVWLFSCQTDRALVRIIKPSTPAPNCKRPKP
jgi:hypothetical protein